MSCLDAKVNKNLGNTLATFLHLDLDFMFIQVHLMIVHLMKGSLDVTSTLISCMYNDNCAWEQAMHS